jgi:aspartate beta-hydroxylase
VSALGQAQRAGQWLDPTSTPAHMKPLVEQAVQTIRDRQRAITDEQYARLAERYGASELSRIAQGLRIYRREEAAQYADPRQQPRFFFMPGLPPTPYFDRALFPWIDEFESRTPAIRDELRAVLHSGDGRERVFLTEETERANLRGIDREPTWNGYYFYRHGKRRDDHCAACPVTAAAIDRLSLSRVPGHGPEVLFSIFTAGTHLLPHRGVTNTRSVLHLPLIVPSDCALNVGGEVHAWQEGRVVVFDDTYEHEAWNRSAALRVVMIADVWNPYLTEIERLALSDLIGALAEVDMVPS